MSKDDQDLLEETANGPMPDDPEQDVEQTPETLADEEDEDAGD